MRKAIIKKTMITLTILLLVSSSCTKQTSDAISVDLQQGNINLLYSSFVDKLDYVHLKAGKECLLTGIKKIYFDNDTILIQDSRNEGIFVFSKGGDLISHINCRGQGPEEFLDDDAVAVDTFRNIIYVYDMMSFKINRYTYDGVFISSDKQKFFMRDFSVVDNKLFAFQPCINKMYKRNGIWSYDFSTQKDTTLLEHKREDELFECRSTYIKQINDTIYYYDRNNDYIYVIENNSISTLVKLSLKQFIPISVRKVAAPNPNELYQRAMIFDFCPSNKQFFMSYFIFDEEENYYRYVMMNPKTKDCSVFTELVNDMDSYVASDPKIFCINGNTWCRIVDQEENSEIITLQILCLKD